MYKCDDCGYEFKEPRQGQEYMGQCHGTPAYREYSICPSCGSEEYDCLDEQCEECGSFIDCVRAYLGKYERCEREAV